MTAVRQMTNKLEQIRARKLAEMIERSKKHERSPESRVPVELTDSNFESAMRANHLILVDCWAAWCYPCRLIAPIVEELTNEYSSLALFAKLNVDDSPATAMRYSIQSIPTILIIKDGVEVERIVGAAPRVQIETALRKHL